MDYKQSIFNKKYRFNNETIEQFYDRTSGGNEVIKGEMKSDRFVFGGRILSNRGLRVHGIKSTYSNCYVVPPPEDSIESIFDTAKRIARIYSYGGGCGINLSKLRPNGAAVNNSAKTTSGATSFSPLFDLTTDIICQNGRRGALMLSLMCTHPDIVEFINMKYDVNKITKANISVMFTDDFLYAVENDEMFDLTFKVEATGEVVTRTVNAKGVMLDFAYNNYETAEPGALFWDRIKKWSLLSEDKNFEFSGVNPCAEQPLPSNGSCLLGSINLSSFVLNPFTDDSSFDFGTFEDTVSNAVIALNEVLDEGLDLHPLDDIKRTVGDYRQIGLGLMGYADMLIKLGLKYGSTKALSITTSIGDTMINSALKTSALLARDFGAYPKYDAKAVLSSPFLNYNADKDTIELIEKYGLRNSQLLTIAPTGSTAPLVNASWACEPLYDISYKVKTESLDGKESYYDVFTPIITELMQVKGISSISDLPDYVVSSKDIPWRDRINTQAVLQTFIDASISSTVNLPEYVSTADVFKLYMYAWKSGLKGVTIYRDNCKRSGTLTSNLEAKEATHCPTCGAELIKVEGCTACPDKDCGFSMCSL